MKKAKIINAVAWLVFAISLLTYVVIVRINQGHDAVGIIISLIFYGMPCLLFWGLINNKLNKLEEDND